MANRDEHGERIDRMERDGLLTASQAAELRDSVRPRDIGGEGLPKRAKWSLRAIAVVLGLAAVSAVLITAGGDPAPVQDVSSTINQPGGVGAMNANLSKVIGVMILLIVPFLAWVWMHNSLVSKEESVLEAWAQTESNYQRRADLVPALVESISRFIRHESETLTAVTQKRRPDTAQLTDAIEELISVQKEAAKILQDKPETLVQNEEKLSKLYAHQTTLGRNVSNLFAVAEAYPELRSADQFLELQAQLEGTENRINVARLRFNDAVGEFNGTMRKLPWNLVASVGNFQRKAYFQSEKEARRAPELKFE